VRAIVEVSGEQFALPVSVNDRSDMRYPVLIGMDILRSGRFLIDPAKKVRLEIEASAKGKRKAKRHN
jgi:hypothetical protein